MNNDPADVRDDARAYIGLTRETEQPITFIPDPSVGGSLSP